MAAVLMTGDYAAGREETVTMREGMEVIMALNHPEPKSSSAGLKIFHCFIIMKEKKSCSA